VDGFVILVNWIQKHGMGKKETDLEQFLFFVFAIRDGELWLRWSLLDISRGRAICGRC
jgi:hypothetical protein